MTKKILNSYILSNKADSDLDEIFDYTFDEHGFNQAVKYLSDLESLFWQLVKNPKLGRERRDLKNEILSITEQGHTVFYRIHQDYILIVRVLHGNKDIPRSL
ncbi:type II toxin-antitoxin system RelE/ParE family toxin [Cryomorpha ignava]|uniref:Toxin n=1 Tax=Cryomorpha ignava TaxID=101383 RepID=A0A7K3WNP1_9FLAO|nr:type II toxin-antitoxin system RelE/ParE family toxin [Cryomorpha ignava]NEN23273.1 type II toxin-antitoxin system RelE/ParE family toxin [Cryomorpha ignava]